jgi:hypothetical protein
MKLGESNDIVEDGSALLKRGTLQAVDGLLEPGS